MLMSHMSYFHVHHLLNNDLIMFYSFEKKHRPEVARRRLRAWEVMVIQICVAGPASISFEVNVRSQAVAFAISLTKLGISKHRMKPLKDFKLGPKKFEKETMDH